MLKSKIKNTNQEWVNAYNNATSLIPISRINELEKKAILNIIKTSHNFTNICNGWCGGKDSLVLQKLIDKSMIQSTPIHWEYSEEFPCVRDWYKSNRPKNCIVEVLRFFDLNFLENNNDYLFCKGNTRKEWISKKLIIQDKDIKKYQFDLFITGRRKLDGNQCGKKENNYLTKKQNYSVFNPIAEWTNEELLAYLRYNNIELPPSYWFKTGFISGTGAWTDYDCLGRSDFEVLDELYQIDKRIIKEAYPLSITKQRMMSRNIKKEELK